MSVAKPIRVFLSGEGSNELGSYAGHPSYRTESSLGVLHALLKKVEPDGWAIGDAKVWTSIRKYRAKPSADHEDTHNVLGLALDAIEAKCEILVFTRDVDKDTRRAHAVEIGIALVPETFPRRTIAIIGGVSRPALEGWILALLGHQGSEQDRHVEETLVTKGIAKKDGEAMVNVVRDADLSRIPGDATSLRLWLARAQAVLPPRVKQRAVE